MIRDSQPPDLPPDDSLFQGNLFGAPDPIRHRPPHPPGYEAYLGEELKEEVRATCARMMEPVSKMFRALAKHFVAPENRDFRLRMQLLARDDRRKPRGNPQKGGQAAGAKKKKDDNPTPEGQ